MTEQNRIEKVRKGVVGSGTLLWGTGRSSEGGATEVIVHEENDLVRATRRIIDSEGNITISTHGYPEDTEGIEPSKDVIRKRLIELYELGDTIQRPENIDGLNPTITSEQVMRSLLMHE